jgi:hypothetical protein
MYEIIDANGRRKVSQKEYFEYMESLPKPETAPVLEIEYSMDMPSKSVVVVKVIGNDVPFALNYPEGFQWDDNWIREKIVSAE